MPVLLMSLLLACLPGDPGASTADTKVFHKGRLTEEVASVSDAGQRFTLYLPTGFDPAKPTPVIYLLDPRGRARVPAKVFQEAAERYGYILVSSHTTTSDGAVEPNLRAIQAMWDDTNRWFTIDPHRTYVAGFSGTARMASLLAQHRPITGIIGSGAGFHPDVRPSAKMPFLYFGAGGDVDYNFHELEALEHALAALDLPHRVERFPGPHAWLTPDQAMRAIEWFELRAMQAGIRPIDKALVDAWWERDDAIARERLARGEVLDAGRHYAAMARDFSGLRDTAGVRAEARRLASSPEANAQLSHRKAESRRSNEWVHNGMQAIADAFPEGSLAPAIPAWQLAQTLELEQLKKTAASGPAAAALEARRRLNQLEVQLGFYLPADALERSDFVRAGYYLSLGRQIDDASPVSWYLTAQVHARLKDPEQTFVALRRAIDAGFRDVGMVEAEHVFLRLHGHPEYTAIVEQLRGQGDQLDRRTVDRPPARVSR